jgi:peptidoglycan hydrolase CwlO-like protein
MQSLLLVLIIIGVVVDVFLTLKFNKKIMATLAEISAKADELQVALDAEQVQIQTALDSLNALVADLQTQITDGGTAADRQAVLDKLNATISDLEATIP